MRTSVNIIQAKKQSSYSKLFLTVIGNIPVQIQ